MLSNQNDNPLRVPASRPPELRDPVVEEALVRKIATNKQVADAWLKRNSMYRQGKQHPVWRWLAEQEGIDREEILDIAAACYDYKHLDTPPEALKPFVQRIIPCFSEAQWKAMLRVGVVPVKRTTPRGISSLWNFAANDPTSRPIHKLVQQYVGSNYELYQANRKLIASLFAEVYLTKMELPRSPGSDSE